MLHSTYIFTLLLKILDIIDMFFMLIIKFIFITRILYIFQTLYQYYTDVSAVTVLTIPRFAKLPRNKPHVNANKRGLSGRYCLALLVPTLSSKRNELSSCKYSNKHSSASPVDPEIFCTTHTQYTSTFVKQRFNIAHIRKSLSSLKNIL
ncbi:hypothetical protein V1478_012893 [Vespula squamosa]|uniref:Uncharacterized protein n=1 Tax=Vespula squamosa TaxID=30214 RepID=A0ABD2A990_VESSQ